MGLSVTSYVNFTYVARVPHKTSRVQFLECIVVADSLLAERDM